jgi:6-phosphogluconolactonase (cycloisomerase 2 family)
MMSKDGRYVYGSNRQTDFSQPTTDNSIVVFKRDLDSGLLLQSRDYPAWYPLPVGGKTPRHFSFSNDPLQTFVLVGSQQANTLSIFRRHPGSGALSFLAHTDVQAPAVQLFFPHDTQSSSYHKPT